MRTRAATFSAERPNCARCTAWLPCWTRPLGTPIRSTATARPRSLTTSTTAEPNPPARLCSSNVMKRRCVSASSISSVSSSGTHEARVDDGRPQALGLEQVVRVERDVDGVAERQDRDAVAPPQHLGPAVDERRERLVVLALVEPRG